MVEAEPQTVEKKPDDKPSRKSGWIDLEPDPRVDRSAHANGARCCARSGGFSATSSGCPTCRASTGSAIYAHYEPLLDRVSTRAELSDLIWELQGELGTSHAYEMGGDHRQPPQVALGYLGAELERARGRQLRDRAHRRRRSLGCRRGFAAQRRRRRSEGRRAHRRSQWPAHVARAPPHSLLVHQAAAKVELHARASAKGTRARRLVTTLADEVPARYREWVERNRALVHERSEGPRRLPAPAGHDVRGLRRIPPLFRVGMRSRRADRRHPLQPRRARVGAAAGEGRAQAHRLQPGALDAAAELSGRRRSRVRWLR